MRLHMIAPEYEDRVRLRFRAFPLEIYGGGPPDRHQIEMEMWFAALQEPEAGFKPFGDEWPATTLPAFNGAWCAFQQDEGLGRAFDLRIRKAFFSEGRNIGHRGVVLDVASEVGLDMDRFMHSFDGGEARRAVIEEGRRGREKYAVSQTPTVMLAGGQKLEHSLAEPVTETGRITSIGEIPCFGDGCYDATRELFEQALEAH